MLHSILNTPVQILTLGARAHALLASQMPTATARRFERDDWTCHICGVQLVGFMELDHLNGHQPCADTDVCTICQFCHDLRHAIWAANKGRLRILWAPAVSQEILTNLAWQALLAAQDAEGKIMDESMAEAAKIMTDDINRRESVLGNIIGATSVTGLFEALNSLRRMKGEEAYRAAVDKLGEFVRFWPAAINRTLGETVSVAADFGCWQNGDFRSMTADLIGDFWKDRSVIDDLQRLCGEHVPPQI